MRRDVCFAMAISLAVSACATAPKMLWLRADGQRAATDPVLAQQFQMDRTICLGQREKADLSGVTVTQGGIAGIVAAQNRTNAADAVAQGCMAEKGYVLVREDEVAEKQQELAAIAAEKARREAAAAAPTVPVTPSRRAAPAPKQSPAAQPVSAKPI
jgi:hypothetical protein